MDDSVEKMSIEMQLRGLSEASVTEYVKCVRDLQKFYGKPVTEVTESEIKVFYTTWLQKRNWLPVPLTFTTLH